jgi:CubicO group peptidase (beta-lactamase class C family)
MKQIFVLFICIIFFVACSIEEGASNDNGGLEKKVDDLVKPYFDSTKIAGIAIGVFKGNEKILLKSYGFADLEFDVKLPTDASFEIGSVTKQFTAAATMQLAEQGKLSLEDDISKYIKFDTKGKKVTVRHLLSHTSGIKGYTELAFFEDVANHKFKRDTLLYMVEREPFDFDPGEALIYNNTGFFMLGLIIEKVSGMPYEEYLSKNLFEKAGMTNSYYCSESKIIKNRAHGYDTGEKGLVRAAYLDHTWPYSAGSVCSTVEDLVKWNNALHKGKILSEAYYQEFIKPAALNDGTITKYAKGITVTQFGGKRVIEHGGGINGFLSQNSYFPDDDISIVVLVNSTGPVSPGETEKNIAEFIFKKTDEEKHKYEGDLAKFSGTYKGRSRGRDLVLEVKTSDDGTLLVQSGNDKPFGLQYVTDNTWANGWTNGYATYNFKGTADTYDELRVDETYNFYILKKEK